MTGASGFLSRLDDWSDWLSPIVVKEVRQMVRGREFLYSFGLSLLVGLLVAFYGGADALASEGTSGPAIFSWLMSCLLLLGLAVVPLGAFNALRTERADQTLDLMTHTALSPRRIVIGKLAAQCIKLVSLFAALAPFITMSFLLGGMDFLTIVVTLAGLFMWSVWACAACLFMSSASKSKALSGLLFVVLGVTFIGILGQVLGSRVSPVFLFGAAAFPGSSGWWVLAGMTAFCAVSLVNLILLAENRLALAIEDRSTSLRIGFLIQFLLIVLLTVGPLIYGAASFTSLDAMSALGVFGGLQLGLVSVFSVTEDMVLSRRVLLKMEKPRWRYLRIFLPGGGRGAAWVLLQMGIFLFVGLQVLTYSGASTSFGRSMATAADFDWLLAICGYILFFSGVPALLGRKVLRNYIKAPHLRASIFLFLPLMSILAEVLQYMRPLSRVYAGVYGSYHVMSPFRTLSTWKAVVDQGLNPLVQALGAIGLLCYLALILIGSRETRNARASR